MRILLINLTTLLCLVALLSTPLYVLSLCYAVCTDLAGPSMKQQLVSVNSSRRCHCASVRLCEGRRIDKLFRHSPALPRFLGHTTLCTTHSFPQTRTCLVSGSLTVG